MEFKKFAAAVNTQFNKMSEHELYRLDISGQEVWDAYLAAFPEGTNPMYRVRTYHDGSYDRNVIRQIGNVVAIINGTKVTIWDCEDLPYPYNQVASRIRLLLKDLLIDSLFRTKEAKLGYESTIENREDGPHRWFHFHAQIAKKHLSNSPGEAIGAEEAKIVVFQRGLKELAPEAVQSVLELIDEGGLYRGAEMRVAVASFHAMQEKYLPMANLDRNQFLWTNCHKPGAQIRNTVIGTLLQDISEGVDFEKAVRSYESKVAPSNYKRPTAVITKGMVDQAMKKIDELGLENALQRRLAKLTDMDINDVLWADKSVSKKMKGPLVNLLESEIKTPAPKTDKATEISIDDFASLVLPKATSIELFFKNRNRPNLMTITTGEHEDEVQLFRWNNPFAWSYNGNIADSEMRQAVSEKGGRVDGAFRFSHQWNYGKRNASLMDLHVFMPSHGGQRGSGHSNYGNTNRVGWNHRKHLPSGGVQDVDYVDAAPVGYVPVENISFPDKSRMPEGKYHCAIHNWRFRSPTEGGFKAEIEFDGQVFEYEYDKPLKDNEWVEVATVTLKNGEFSIEHHLPCGSASQDVWGIQTEKFVKVQFVMNSPNHWGENHVGNKHWFFILEGCKTDEPVRGIYNEFLHPSLEPHRKVFEVLGSKTKCPVVEEQLSGLGFSSTKRDSILAHVSTGKATRLYNINF